MMARIAYMPIEKTYITRAVILLVEQYYDFAESLAGHYVVMSRGEVVKSGKGADMVRDNVKALLPV